MSLRLRRPDLPRPYKAPWYPLPQIVSIVGIVVALAYIAPIGTSRRDVYVPFGFMLAITAAYALIWTRFVRRAPLFTPVPVEEILMRSVEPVRIMLVDDHAVVRAGYRRFLEQEPGYEVIAEAGSGEEAYGLLQASLPDIVVLDLSMPGQGGLSTLRRLKARWPLLPVLVFSMHDNAPFVLAAMRGGATGYITKSSDPSLMVRAVRSVLDGEVTMSPDVAGKLAHAAVTSVALPMLGLSVREFDVFRMIASGKTHEEIGGLLKLSGKTIANYHSIVRQKLGVATDIELFQLAIECGVIEAPAAAPGEDPDPLLHAPPLA